MGTQKAEKWVFLLDCNWETMKDLVTAEMRVVWLACRKDSLMVE